MKRVITRPRSLLAAVALALVTALCAVSTANAASSASQAVVPLAPSNLIAKAVSPTSVNLTWTNNAPNQSGVVISLDGTESVDLQGATVHSHIWHNLSPGTKYWFYIASKIYGTPGDPTGYGNTQSAWVGPVYVTTPTSAAPQVVNPNWSGYGVISGTYTEVGAYWIVPAAHGSGNRQSAFWVGLGGVKSNLLPGCCLEQVGTSSDTVNGKPRYRAWYEITPSPPVFIGTKKPVSAGDLMEGIVSSRGDMYTFDLYDWGHPGATKLRWSQTWVVTDPGLDNTSAEAIAEDPVLPSGALATLANFGTVGFSDVFFNSIPAYKFHMTTYTLTGGKVKVAAFDTNPDGTDGFKVTYEHS
jgi:Peptidase A4 family